MFTILWIFFINKKICEIVQNQNEKIEIIHFDLGEANVKICYYLIK